MSVEIKERELGIVRVLLSAIGEDVLREGLKDTPKRVVKSWAELYGGYGQDPKAVLGTTFKKDGYDELVLLKDIQFFSTCEHHMLPFFGKAHVAYIPSKRVVGLSKLARLVEVFSRRLQIQERLTVQIAESINEVLEPRGVGVVLEATHFCMIARGVSKQQATMVTSSMLGAFRDKPEAREELLRLIGK
jgi:GTP cyclohydrolase I